MIQESIRQVTKICDLVNVLFILHEQSKINSFTPKMGTTIQKCCSDGTDKPYHETCNHKKVLLKEKKGENRGRFDVSHSDCISSKGQTTVDQTKDDEQKKDSKVKKYRSLTKIQQVIPKLNFDDFHIDGILGAGAFGTVYLGELRKNKENGIQQKLAIKCVYKQLLRKKDALDQAKYEKKIALSKNTFIVSLLMSFQDDFRIYFAMEYAEGGDTYNLIKGDTQKVDQFKNLGENAVRFIAGCVILGLQFLHSQGYMYRDLKPQNVMLFGDGYIKLTDFGLAIKCQKGQTCRITKGTLLYLAPEMVLKKGYDKRIDLWALGVYLFQLSCFTVPFLPSQITKERFESAYNQFKADKRWFDSQISSQLKDLIQSLIKFNPSERLGSNNFQQLKSHKFFNGFDWSALKDHKMQSPLKYLAKRFPVRPQRSKKPNVQIPLSSKSCENLKKLDDWSYYGNYAHYADDI